MMTLSGAAIPCSRAGEIRRVADDATFLRLFRTQEIADDHDPRRDANSHMQRRACCTLQLWRGFDDRKPGANRALGVMLVRLRIAEIGEHAVAHVLGDETSIALDQARAAFVIGHDDAAHVLGIEPRGKRRRAHQITEHHRQLAALGDVVSGRFGSGHLRGGGGRLGKPLRKLRDSR
jgi:hypothetical protein